MQVCLNTRRSVMAHSEKCVENKHACLTQLRKRSQLPRPFDLCFGLSCARRLAKLCRQAVICRSDVLVAQDCTDPTVPSFLSL